MKFEPSMFRILCMRNIRLLKGDEQWLKKDTKHKDN